MRYNDRLDMDKETRFLGIMLIIAVILCVLVFQCIAPQPARADLRSDLQIASQEAAAEADAACMSEWYELLNHDSIYADWNHLWFSWYGYRHATVEDIFRTYAFRWWGCPVPIPAPFTILYSE